MSRFNIDQFNIWFPAIVVGLFITIVSACVLAILRRYCPCLRRILGNHSDAENQRQASPHAENQQAAPQPQGNQRREAIERMFASTHEPAAAAVEHRVQIGDGSVEAPVTVWFPDSCLPEGFAARVYEYIAQRAQRVVHRWTGSIVIQALLSIDSRALCELEEFAQQCSSAVKGFYVQIGEWGIFFHNGESFQLYRLKEREVPEVVEAVWQNMGFIVRGFYLNGSNIKQATAQSSATLRTVGPPQQVCGQLEELYVPTEGLNVGKSPIFASRVVDIDGYLLAVRSQVTCIVPPHEKSFKEPSRGGLSLKILLFKVKMKSLLRFPGCRPKTAQRTPKRLEELEKLLEISVSDLKRQLLVEHWKGVSESEMLDFRTKVLHHLQTLPSGSDRYLSRYNLTTSMQVSSSDQEYWQRGLNDMNEVFHVTMDSSQSSVLFRIRARIKLFVGQFESAAEDFELADELYGGRPSSTDMLERATVKCALARYSEAVRDESAAEDFLWRDELYALSRYSEAMQDVMAAAAINPNRNEVKALQTCLEQVLHLKLQHEHGPDLLTSNDTIQRIPDLLTGDKWSPDRHRTSSITSEYDRDRIRSMPEMNSRKFVQELNELIHVSKVHWTELDDELEIGMSSEERSSKQAAWTESITSGFEVGKKIAEGAQAEMHEAKWWRYTGADLEVGKKIAEGAQAEIYEAKWWRFPGADFVVKKFKKGFPVDHLVWLTDSPPGICRAVGVTEREDHILALVLPRYWGDLRRLIDQRTMPFDVRTSLDLMCQIAAGMQALHTRGIVHRDLKPSNVLVERFGEREFRCYVADFECVEGNIGTVRYRAPEVFQAVRDRSHTPSFSMKTDVYSFGILCSEILTGRLPYEGHSHVGCGDEIRFGLRPPLPPGLGPALRTLINQCWHSDPKQRPNFTFICEELRRISCELITADQPSAKCMIQSSKI